jgi:hypothetical protein
VLLTPSSLRFERRKNIRASDALDPELLAPCLQKKRTTLVLSAFSLWCAEVQET